jgi:hypothetical protein
MKMPMRPGEKTAGGRNTQKSYLAVVDRDLSRRVVAMRRRKKQPSWFERHGMAVRYGVVAAFAMTVGAGFAMLFDPAAGRRRRARSRDKAAKAWHQGSKRTARSGRRAMSFARGQSQRTMHAVQSHHYDNSDLVVLDRIESTVFRDPDLPKGQLNIDVVHGRAVIRGAVTSPYWIREVERRVREVPGVERVENLMHMMGTEAPNKADAIEASAQAWHEHSLPRTY